MFRRILVPLDGSTFAEAALPAAFTLAQKNGGEIRFLCVLEPVGSYPGALHTPDNDWAKGYLAKASERTQQTWDGALTTSVRNGLATNEIAAEAEAWKADAIVLATHGRGGVSRAWMGSVADRLIRTATRPLLAVRPPKPGTSDSSRSLAISQVVVPLDGSELAEAALPYGAALAKQFGVPLALIRVLTHQNLGGLSYVPDTIDLSTQASQYLKEHIGRLSRDGVEVTENVVADGAAHAVLSQADGDLVVMSTHGRTGTDRVLLGSVADKVVRGATGAVLVIPPRAGRPRHDDASQVAAGMGA